MEDSMALSEQIEELARKHGATSYRNRADTQNPAYGFTPAGLLNLIAEVTGELRKQDEALIKEHAQALSFLCGLHACMTIDGPPMVVAERIFDAVLAERAELLEQIKRMERNLEAMRQYKRTTS